MWRNRGDGFAKSKIATRFFYFTSGVTEPAAA